MFWLVAIWPLLAHANPPIQQRLAHDQWSMADGLPYVGAYDLAIDADGYLWLGSMAGLARFDGRRFKVFDSATVPAMTSNIIGGIATDRAGRMWVGTRAGVLYYEHGRFIPFPPSGQRDIRVLGLDRHGDVLLSDLDAVWRVDAQLTLIQAWTVPEVTAARDDGQDVWLAAGNHIHRASVHGVSQYTLATTQPVQVFDLMHYGQQVLASTSAGLFRWQDDHWERHPEPVLHQRIHGWTQDKDGNLWVGVDGAILRLRGADIIEIEDIRERIPGNRLMLADAHGRLWVTSGAHGLHRLWAGTADSVPLHTYRKQPDYLWAITAWQERLITAGSFGVAELVGDTIQSLPDAPSIPEVYSLYPDGERLWIGSTSGVYLMQGRHTTRPSVLQPLRDKRANTFLRDRDGNLWIGTLRGLYLLDPEERLHRISGDDSRHQDDIRALLQTKDGRLYAAGARGLMTYENGQLVPVALPDPNQRIITLVQLPDGRLLAGAYTSDILYLQGRNGWIRIDRRHGLPRNEIYAATYDGMGGVVVSGLRGAYRLLINELNRLEEHPEHLLHIEGLLTLNRQEFPGQQALCCLGGGAGRSLVHDGKLYLSAADRIYILPPTPATNSDVTHLQIDQLSVGGQQHAGTKTSLPLAADQRDLRIDFSARNLSPLHSPRLQYRLQGYDRQWHLLPTNSTPSVQYTNLPAGTYHFEITDTNSTPAAVARQTFSIAPAFHETRAFKASVMAGGAGTLWLAMLGSAAHNRRKRRHLEGLIQSRTHDLAQANAQLDTLARTDPLTGLNNRRHAASEIPARLQPNAGAAQGPAQHLFVLMDIDHFKIINDTHGHDVGDAVLMELAQRLRGQLRDGDCLARWGGEEFLMVCFDLPPGEHPALGDRLLRAAGGALIHVADVPPLAVTVSLGMALHTVDDSSAPSGWNAAVRQADIALYSSKANGRNRWTLYHEDLASPPVAASHTRKPTAPPQA